MADILTHAEAEAYVRELRAFELQEVGSRAWQVQHQRLEKLNLQAHQNLSYAREEYVSELLSSYQKWDVVLDELTCVFLFKQRVWPAVFSSLARAHGPEARELVRQQTPVSVFLYTILFHEAVLCNLVSATIIDRLPQAEHLDDLIDWASTRIRSLITRELSYVRRGFRGEEERDRGAAAGADKGATEGSADDPDAEGQALRRVLDVVFSATPFDPRYPAESMKELLASSGGAGKEGDAAASLAASAPSVSPTSAITTLCQSLYQQDCDITYKVALECTTIFRGLTGHDLPLNARHKLQTNRAIVSMARLLAAETVRSWGEMYPWQRVLKPGAAPGAGGARYQHLGNHGEWVDYTSATERAYRLSLYEAQAWIAMLQLAVQNTTEFTAGEVDVLESIKGRINEALVDQLPPLKELRRFLEQVCLSRPAAEASAPGTLPYYQQKVRHNYSLGDPLTDPRAVQQLAPGAVLVQLESSVEKDLVRRLRFWADAVLRRQGRKPEEAQPIVSLEEAAYSVCARQLCAGFPNLSVRELAEGFSVEGYSAVVPLCNKCGRPAKFRCSKCRAVWYCGRECQVKDWKGGHKASCGKAAAGGEGGGVGVEIGADIRPSAPSDGSGKNATDGKAGNTDASTRGDAASVDAIAAELLSQFDPSGPGKSAVPQILGQLATPQSDTPVQRDSGDPSPLDAPGAPSDSPATKDRLGALHAQGCENPHPSPHPTQSYRKTETRDPLQDQKASAGAPAENADGRAGKSPAETPESPVALPTDESPSSFRSPLESPPGKPSRRAPEQPEVRGYQASREYFDELD